LSHGDENEKEKFEVEEELASKLETIVQKPNINYTKLTQILEAGKAKEIDEIVECASISYRNFVAIKRLGSGKFATAYLIQNIGVENILHVLKLRKSEQEDTIGLEAKVFNLKGKRHENIVEMYAFVQDIEVDGENTTAIDMEYIEGRDLRKILEGGALNPETAINYALQILYGLSYLHSQSIHHRDLRPENIMITKDEIVKLIDFGLATSKEITARPKMNRLYAAPEFRIDREYDNSDLWSFGLIVYEMLSGQHLIKPYEKDVYDSVERFKDYVAGKEKMWAQVQVEVDAKYIKRIRNNVPAELQEIVVKCLKVDSNIRYQSIDRLINDIKNVAVSL